MFGSMECRLGSFMKPDLRTLVNSAAAIGLSAALMAAPAIAHHKPDHNAGGGGDDGGGDATYWITLTDLNNGVIAEGEGVDGPGNSIDGVTDTDSGSFVVIELALISTDPASSITAEANVQADYNALCGDVVNLLHASEDIDDIRVLHDFEIDTITVAVNYTVTEDGQTQPFTLLLQGPDKPPGSDEAVFPPTETIDLTLWNNRGGGKGNRNRCGTGHRDLNLVTLDVVAPPQ